MNSFLYSYTDFIRERNFFRMVDDKGINRYDSPSALYYKIIFYFTDDSGLLGVYNLSDDVDNDIANIKTMTAAFNRNNRNNKDPEPNTSAKKINYRNTAYNYLLVNDEIERAEMLKQFIILLSDINTSAPWYFQEISGLDGALERKIFSEGEVKLEDKPRQFTIKCLQDAYDNRIGTLLDLYRAACFSYQNKKTIYLPEEDSIILEASNYDYSEIGSANYHVYDIQDAYKTNLSNFNPDSEDLVYSVLITSNDLYGSNLNGNSTFIIYNIK